MKMTPRMAAAVQKAELELQTKSLHAIQIETAYTWCGRALVAAELGMRSDAVEFSHEAIEHAALSGDNALLAEVREELSYRNL